MAPSLVRVRVRVRVRLVTLTLTLTLTLTSCESGEQGVTQELADAAYWYELAP